MHLEGSREFDAPISEVYEALTDPELVSSAIPAMESLTVKDHEHWTAHVRVSVAPRLKVSFEVIDRRPPEHARLRAHGKNFGAGATLDTSFDLSENGSNRTAMRYSAEFQLSGLLGRLGDAALRPIVERQVGRLFDAVDRHVAG
jgi:carbon monoxide dehydrogenase subunit G